MESIRGPDCLQEFILPQPSTSNNMDHSGAPVSPTKKYTARLNDPDRPPESPDMKFARNRLGTLLTSIKKGDAPPVTSDKVSGPDEKRQTGRPKKPLAAWGKTKDGETMFEIKGRLIALYEERNYPVYQLAKAYIKGRVPVDDRSKPPPPIDDCISMELLATRNVTAIPRSAPSNGRDALWPEMNSLDNFDSSISASNAVALKSEYIRHWRSVKKTWCYHTRQRNQRHQRINKLFETMYSIAQQ